MVFSLRAFQSAVALPGMLEASAQMVEPMDETSPAGPQFTEDFEKGGVGEPWLFQEIPHPPISPSAFPRLKDLEDVALPVQVLEEAHLWQNPISPEKTWLKIGISKPEILNMLSYHFWMNFGMAPLTIQ